MERRDLRLSGQLRGIIFRDCGDGVERLDASNYSAKTVRSLRAPERGRSAASPSAERVVV